MILAESLYDPEIRVANKSRLAISLLDLQQDQFAQAYFDAFAEGQESATCALIKIWIQICRFRWNDNHVDACMTTADSHDRKAHSLLHRCTHDHNIRNMLPHDLILKLQASAPLMEILDPVLAAISGPIELAFMSFMSSQFYLKCRIDIMTKGHISLSDVLFYDETLFYFLDFMEGEGMRRYADFLLVMHGYRNADPTQVDRQGIWKKFFGKGHDSSDLCLDDECSQYLQMPATVCNRVKQEMLNGQRNCFEYPASLLHQYLERTYFKQFLESQAYTDITTKFIKKFQEMQIDPMTSRSFQLLGEISAAESTSSDQVKDQPSISPDELSRPDRRLASGASTTTSSDKHSKIGMGTLQIVRIDGYGRVISDLEPEPTDKKQERSNVSMSIRKLVTRSVPNQDAKQALAWKIAQMTIDDVVNLTREYT